MGWTLPTCSSSRSSGDRAFCGSSSRCEASLRLKTPSCGSVSARRPCGSTASPVDDGTLLDRRNRRLESGWRPSRPVGLPDCCWGLAVPDALVGTLILGVFGTGIAYVYQLPAAGKPRGLGRSASYLPDSGGCRSHRSAHPLRANPAQCRGRSRCGPDRGGTDPIRLPVGPAFVRGPA